MQDASLVLVQMEGISGCARGVPHFAFFCLVFHCPSLDRMLQRSGEEFWEGFGCCRVRGEARKSHCAGKPLPEQHRIQVKLFLNVL